MDKRKVFPRAHPDKKFEAYPQLWIVKAGIIWLREAVIKMKD